MHNGQFDKLEDAVSLYIESAALARAGKLRNAAPELQHININATDINALVAFIKALNEDYD